MGNMELSWIAEPLMHTYLKLHFLLLKFKRDWMVDEKELRVIHYTLGPLKPWDWWTSWLLKPVDVWQDVRERLWESLLGTRGGQNPNDYFLVKFIFLLPFCALLFCCYHSFMKVEFGSMVVEPSETVFNDMVNKIKTIASYTRGDQGFLNSYFPGFPNAHVFDPNLSPEVLKSRPVPEMVVWIASIFMPQEAVGFLQFRASRSLGFLPYLVNAVLSCLECCLCCRF